MVFSHTLLFQIDGHTWISGLRHSHRCLKSREASRLPHYFCDRMSFILPPDSTLVFFLVAGFASTELWIQDGQCHPNGGVWPWEPHGGWNKCKKKPDALNWFLSNWIVKRTSGKPLPPPTPISTQQLSTWQLKPICQEIPRMVGFCIITHANWIN